MHLEKENLKNFKKYIDNILYKVYNKAILKGSN